MMFTFQLSLLAIMAVELAQSCMYVVKEFFYQRQWKDESKSERNAITLKLVVSIPKFQLLLSIVGRIYFSC